MKARIIVSALLLLAIGLPGAAAGPKPVNTTLFGTAIKGYDPVAYFTDSKPIKGDPAYMLSWSGAEWQFASAEHRDAFQAAPEKYAPQFGGYCSWAVSQGYTAGIDPEAWRIVDGKLYLNYSRSVQERWEKDIPGNIAKAEANWPQILQK